MTSPRQICLRKGWTFTKRTPGCCAVCCNSALHRENPEDNHGRRASFQCMLFCVLSGGYMKFRFTPVGAALGLALGLLVSGNALAADTIKIAVAGPFTGALTQYGTMVKEGVDTAIEQINAAGGVLGKQLVAVSVDDGCEPKQGPVVANRVVNDEIHYVVGHVCSG